VTPSPRASDPPRRPTGSDVSLPRFREVMGTFATGVVVVAAVEPDGTPVGLTVQSFASLSLRPPLVVFCPARTSRTWPRIRRVGSFCVNVLADDQADVATVMAAGGVVDRFEGLDWTPGRHGAPRLTGALAHVEATVVSVQAGGDHDVVVGRVHAVEHGRPGAGAGPLLYHQGRYARILGEESAR